MENNNLQNLIKKVEGNDRRAFDLFYDLYYDQVFRYTYFILKDEHACREVISDVFLSIWVSRKKLGDIQNLNTYLYVVAKNESVRYLNRKKKEEQLLLTDISVQLENHHTVTPEDLLLEKELEVVLNKAINELPEKCRIIFMMARQEGLKPKEIAEALSVQESTVRVQMKIATEKLIDHIKTNYPDITLPVLLAYFYSLF